MPGDVRVASSMLAISVGEQCNKPRRSRSPPVHRDAAATAANFDSLVDRHFQDPPALWLADWLCSEGTASKTEPLADGVSAVYRDDRPSHVAADRRAEGHEAGRDLFFGPPPAHWSCPGDVLHAGRPVRLPRGIREQLGADGVDANAEPGPLARECASHMCDACAGGSAVDHARR